MNHLTLGSPLTPATAAAPTRPWQRLLLQWVLWRQRVRQRQALLALSDHLLKDIGLSRAAAWQEAHKPFWQG